MGQITKDHRFQPYQDLHYKAAIFTKQLEEMERISMEMQAQINKELETSSGKIVEETLNALKMNHLDEKLLIDSKILLFEILASQYHSHINDMNIQSITIYYKVIDD